MSNYAVGDRIITPSKRYGTVSSVRRKITITWDNGLSAEYTPKQLQAWNYRKFLEEKGAIAECNSHSLTSAQELGRDSVMQVCNSDLTSSELPRLTNTAVISLPSDIQTLTTTATCEKSPNVQNADLVQSLKSTETAKTSTLRTICTRIESTSLQQVPLVPHFLQKANDLEQTTSETVSPQSSKLSENCNLNLLPLKTSPACSPAHINQDMSMATSGIFFSTFPQAGTMRNGLLSEADTLPVPLLESEYCWLRSPGALSSTGKGRPPGQTKQEAELKRLGLINKGEVLNPAILCQWYEIPENWLDPSECQAATELLEANAQQQEIFSILESQSLPYSESVTSPISPTSPVTRANIKPGIYIINQSETLGIIKQNLGFGFVVDWFGNQFTYNWERDNQQIKEFAIAPQHLITKFLEVVDRDYTCDKCSMQCTPQKQDVHCPSCESPLIKLNDGCGVCGWIPENFLEEKREAEASAQQPKPSKQKGCLYKYLENKKLKNGTIASYPRVIGDRKPDNPNHWRWGFNWEEKIDGEWKGRSIGSIPVGAIPLIEDMRSRNVPLEEIINFIKRSKEKKS